MIGTFSSADSALLLIDHQIGTIGTGVSAHLISIRGAAKMYTDRASQIVAGLKLKHLWRALDDSETRHRLRHQVSHTAFNKCRSFGNVPSHRQILLGTSFFRVKTFQNRAAQSPLVSATSRSRPGGSLLERELLLNLIRKWRAVNQWIGEGGIGWVRRWR